MHCVQRGHIRESVSHHVTVIPVALFTHHLSLLSLSLQAVETNLASKDSHWVFVNEVREIRLTSW